MYSRRTGILQTSTEGLKKIESFNNNLRDQYNHKLKNNSSQTTVANKTTVNQLTQNNLKNIAEKMGTFLGNEEVILIALILLLFLDVNRDYLIIGILAMLLLLG